MLELFGEDGTFQLSSQTQITKIKKTKLHLKIKLKEKKYIKNRDYLLPDFFSNLPA